MTPKPGSVIPMSDEHRVLKPYQEWDAGERCLIGRDPRRMTTEGLRACGIVPQPLLAVIRAKCLDCVGHQPSEVRRCGNVTCPNWPYRMSANPFRAKRQLSEAQCVALNRGRAVDSPGYYPRETEEEVPEVLSSSRACYAALADVKGCIGLREYRREWPCKTGAAALDTSRRRAAWTSLDAVIPVHSWLHHGVLVCSVPCTPSSLVRQGI
jgi:hypothetical protein